MRTKLDIFFQMSHDLILRLQHGAFFGGVGDLEHEGLATFRLKQKVLVAFAGQGFGLDSQVEKVAGEMDCVFEVEFWGVVEEGHEGIFQRRLRFETLKSLFYCIF